MDNALKYIECLESHCNRCVKFEFIDIKTCIRKTIFRKDGLPAYNITK